jgi:predicted RND superfamily exporter protein
MTATTQSLLTRVVASVTRACAKHAGLVLLVTLTVLGACWWYAAHLKIRGDFIELLPTESPAAKRFRATVDRRGGASSTLIVVVASPDPARNQAVIDSIEREVRKLPRGLLSMVEHGPAEARRFYERWRWLFADPTDLALVECELDRARMRATPGYLELDDPCVDLRDARDARDRAAAATAAASADPTVARPAPPPAVLPGESALRAFDRRAQAELATRDQFPTGYFRDESGRTFVLIVRSPSGGFGDSRGDELFAKVQRIVATERARLPASVEIGFAGDIPNAIAERKALQDDITTVSSIAILLVLLSIVIFFRSPLVLVHIGLAVFTGAGVAFAVAMGAYGHLNAATSFLGSIIFGNGINYGIVYYARYRERRGAGDSIDDALVDAAETCRSGTWLASLAASGAYGALVLTSFRGFSEFGLIGGVGMLACWVATFLISPASISLVERVRARFRKGSTKPAAAPAPERAPIAQLVGRVTTSFAWPIVASAVLLSIAAGLPLKKYLANPWEYDFSKLRSKSSSERGAGQWSRRSNDVLRTRGAPQLLLARDLSEVTPIAAQVLASDRRVTGGTFVERVETIWDVLGGTPADVQKKLELLGLIREHLDHVAPHLDAEERVIAQRWRPPEYLRELRPADLPNLVRERFREKDGRDGTAVFVFLRRGISQSRGENLLKISDILDGVRDPRGQVVPNASRAAIFAEMVRSLERDSPRVTLIALLVVMLVTLIVSHRPTPVLAVLGSLVCGVLWMVGGAAWLDVRLNFLNFVALPLTFGIGIEYAINLFERIRHFAWTRTGTKEGALSVTRADIAEGVRSVGGAVFLCSLTTMLGYGSLLFADNLALQSFGRYAIGGEIACTIAALLVMPAALSARFGRAKAPAPGAGGA